MPVLYQKMIYRTDLHRNRNVLYLFGDNLTRRGLGGQAEEMRGEPNAIGVVTKAAAFKGPGAFFHDDDFQTVTALIWKDLQPAFAHAKTGGLVVIPSDGLGTNRAELAERAPAIFEFLNECLESLAKI